jgi:hypothetical protein
VLAREDFLTYLDPACINSVTEQVVNVAASKGTSVRTAAARSGRVDS